MARILIIDDNETMREGMAATVRRMGHEALAAGGGAEGLALMRKQAPDFLITDLKMEGIGGLEVVEAAKRIDPACPALIVTAFGSVETAVEAMRLGAMDFLGKPFAPEVLRLKVERALEMRREKLSRQRAEAEVEVLRADAAAGYVPNEMVGRSSLMLALFESIAKVAASDVVVHIAGESGTGKELVARAIHLRSRRAGGPFVKVNCGALTDTLLESELFGHEKGAFTGAIKRKLGRFELADKGTLFLDEVGDMTPNLQLKLLRVLQEKQFERVGGEETVEVDVRVVSATHRDLKAAVEAGQFREDLFYRLHVVPFRVPPLRERREDIPLLVEHFIAKLAPRANPRVRRIEENALARLTTYGWPGNVRELENVIERGVLVAKGSEITIADLPESMREETTATSDFVVPPHRTLAEIEKMAIVQTLQRTNWNKQEAAQILGLYRPTLYSKMKKHNIEDMSKAAVARRAGASA
jgi:two-component system, NtrC family, response regulator HydG